MNPSSSIWCTSICGKNKRKQNKIISVTTLPKYNTMKLNRERRNKSSRRHKIEVSGQLKRPVTILREAALATNLLGDSLSPRVGLNVAVRTENPSILRITSHFDV
jgi:protein tyrosine phosphatase